MSSQTKPCPRCGGLASRTENHSHSAGHTAHASLHAFRHGFGVMGLLGAVSSLIAATGALDKYQCTRCGHKF
jgi:hypothetical protein